MYDLDMNVQDFDPDLWSAIKKEIVRQEDHLELIASENYASPRVLALQGSVLTNKYAEGYPGKRYYGGCEYVDIVEQLAIDRAKQLFGADYANVQPHSGSQANAAVYMALLSPGDTVLAMDLVSGGHLTHGANVNFSGKLYNFVHYGVSSKNGEIDYNQVESLAKTHRPKLIVAGFSAYSRVLDWSAFRAIADQVGAYLFVDMAHIAGLVAAGCYPSPVSIADVTTTTTHKTLRGPRSGLILAKSNPEIEKRLSMAIFPGYQGGPLLHAIAAKAVAFKEAMSETFKTYQQRVIDNSRTLAATLMRRHYPVVSGGTDNHMFLISLLDKHYTGKQVEQRLEEAFITLNKNAVPGDTRSPFLTSGIRLGTPALTTRGMGEAEMKSIGEWIADCLDNLDMDDTIVRVRGHVKALCQRFPVYEAHRAICEPAQEP